MKKSIAIASTDWHLKRENIDQIIDLVLQQCKLAVKLNVKQLICLGDVFDSRIAQRQDVLTAFGQILNLLEEYDLNMTIIPGNHDKTLYESNESFLDPFRSNKRLFLIRINGSIPMLEHNIQLHFIPYFSEEKWLKTYNDYLEYLNDILDDEKKHILLTHIAVTGSCNNDGSLVTSKLSTKIFGKFFKVFSGHYHDQQKIGKNFYHIPSIQQNNFGENEDKGFTVLYDDGSHELIQSKFKKYINVEFDLEDTNYLDIVTSKKLYEKTDDNIRFTIKGSENKLKAINKQEFEEAGIDLKLRVNEIEESIKLAEENVVELNSSLIIDEFANFCDKEDLDFESGVTYLKQILKWN